MAKLSSSLGTSGSFSFLSIQVTLSNTAGLSTGFADTVVLTLLVVVVVVLVVVVVVLTAGGGGGKVGGGGIPNQDMVRQPAAFLYFYKKERKWKNTKKVMFVRDY